MPETSDLDATIARLEAALDAAATALAEAQARPDLSDDLAAAQARITMLEQAAEASASEARAAEARAAEAEAVAAQPKPADDPEETVRLRSTLGALQGTLDDLRSGKGGAADASLQAEVEALRAARAMDLAEMKTLLAELEPMLESADA